MKLLAFFILLFISAEGMSQTLGEGEWSLGVSKSQDKTNYGANIGYSLESESSIEKTFLHLLAEHSTNDQTISALNTYSELYQKDLISFDLNNELFLYKPSISWLTDGNFEHSKLIDNNQNNDDWDIQTGPSIERRLRNDISISAKAAIGKSDTVNNESINRNYELALNKVFPSTNEFGFLVENQCWDYSDRQLIDNCIMTYSTEYEIKGRAHNISMLYGTSIIDDTREDVYSISYLYKFNSIDQFKISHSKEKSNLKSRVENISSVFVNPIPVIKKESKFEFNKQFSRLSTLIEASKIIYDSELGQIEEKEFGTELNYAIRSPACLSCALIFTSRMSELQFSTYKEYFVGISYPVKRNLIGLLTFSHTANQLLGKYYSLNFQIKYNSDKALLASE